MTRQKTISPSDEEILIQYRSSGDQALIGNLFNNYMHLVYGLCLKYLKNTEDSKDAVMSIYEHISIKLKSTEVQHFKSWLYMVSKNHCLMQLRKKNPEISADVFMETAEAMHLKDGEDDLEDDLTSLEECVEELKTEQRECVKQFFIEKKSYQEVNKITGIEIKKIKSHIQNGKRNLKICLEDKNVKR